MSELIKRILTSIILLFFFALSMYSISILTFFLIFCFYQMFYETFYILKKNIKINIKLFILSIIVLIYFFFLINFIWLSLSEENNQNKLILFFVITITISSDIGGYVFGKLFKGKKLTKLSPKKTYSGMLGSYILAIIFSYIIFVQYISLTDIIIYSFIISSSSQIGDIFFSYLKRNAKIKDSGNILPGHGGLLDRFDGIVLALPIGVLLFKYL